MIISAKALAGYLLFIAGVTILFSLGLWQLDRGLEKAAIAELTSAAAEAQPTPIDRSISWQQASYQRATLGGKWIPEKTLLMENRLFQGQPGYEVLVPFELQHDRQWLLVNRGWIAATDMASAEGRAALVQIPGEDNPLGQLYQPEAGFTLGETLVQPLTDPARFLYYDFEALSGLLGQSLAPAVLVLDENHSASFRRIWQPGSISPERHYAYTVQWWGLTLTLLIFGLIWRRRA